MKTVLLLVALSIALAGCGIKGDPVPPGTGQSQQTQ